MATGTPLGVCVNCVAPIAKAMHEGGRSVQTSLAVMFSSPTLNIIVLTMLFTLLPPYLAVIKLGFTFLLILGIVPFLAGHEESPEPASDPAAPLSLIKIREPWPSVFSGVFKDYLVSFKYIVIRTVPLMFLAGLLGALMSHLWDPSSLIGTDPSLLTVAGVAMFGTFLPLPIAVDVMMTQSLFAANVPMVVVMTLLFTLGSFSVYSFLIVWRTFSARMAIKLFFIISFLGLASGYLAQAYHDFKSEAREARYQELVVQNEDSAKTRPASRTEEWSAGFVNLQATSRQETIRVYANDELTIEQAAFGPRSPDDVFPFTKRPATEFGISFNNHVDAHNFIEPFVQGRGLTSGDFNRDGWVDIAAAAPDGFELYQNINGRRFKKVNLNIPALAGREGLLVAMADLNNDGWPDFYVTTFADGSFLVLNPLGDVPEQNVIPIPGRKTLATLSLSMGDTDRDGWLDVLHGNWNGGELLTQPGEYATNELLLNKGLRFSPVELPRIEKELPGNSLTALISDINHDGRMDLMGGNDVEVADQYYLNLGENRFQAMEPGNTIIPESPLLNMSIDTADYNNDLLLDIYMTGGAWLATPKDQLAIKFKDSKYCNRMKDTEERRICIETWMLARSTLMPELMECDAMKEMFGVGMERDCMVTNLMHRFKTDRGVCERIPASYGIYRTTCEFMSTAPPSKVLENSDYVPQVLLKNILLTNQGSGSFREESESKHVNFGGWSWSGKFADIDNDEWQDLYIVNGSVYAALVGPTTHTTNMFFHNRFGSLFKIRHNQFGLDDLDHSSAFTYLDFDNDGDLDIISNTTFGPLKLFRNNEQMNNSIAFELLDRQGNRSCVGCKIVIHYGSEGQYHQIREIKAGGAFMSFDAPLAHFGLGDHKRISRIEILWSQGQKSEITEQLQANGRYRVERL
jgi:uncharacterized membrane protein YraQ (UPF0718 family)